jgi:hypothetical protein
VDDLHGGQEAWHGAGRVLETLRAQTVHAAAARPVAALTDHEVAVLDRDRLSWWQLDSASPLGEPVRLTADPTLPPQGGENVMARLMSSP